MNMSQIRPNWFIISIYLTKIMRVYRKRCHLMCVLNEKSGNRTSLILSTKIILVYMYTGKVEKLTKRQYLCLATKLNDKQLNIQVFHQVLQSFKATLEHLHLNYPRVSQ